MSHRTSSFTSTRPTSDNNHSRRQFCRQLSTLLLVGSLPALAACNNFEPRPFNTGRTVTPPLGCTELLQRDPRGDC